MAVHVLLKNEFTEDMAQIFWEKKTGHPQAEMAFSWIWVWTQAATGKKDKEIWRLYTTSS